MEKIGQAVRIARIRAKMRQGELARLVGITQATLSIIECEHRNPELETAFRIADALGVTVDELRGGAS